MNNIEYKAVTEIVESFLNNEKVEILGISVGEERQVRQAIENLIQRNKELEQIEKEHKEENERLRDRIKELEEIDLTTVYMNGIYGERDRWKKKVKEKIEKIKKEKDLVNLKYFIRVLQKLLGE